MNYIQMASVPIIATIVYWLINALKFLTKDNEKVKRFLPEISAALGIITAIVIYYINPKFILAESLLSAIISGAASGLSATGFNQSKKQLLKFKADILKKTEPPANNNYINNFFGLDQSNDFLTYYQKSDDKENNGYTLEKYDFDYEKKEEENEKK